MYLTEIYKIQTRKINGIPYYSISLPKRWVEGHGLQGEEVLVQYNGEREILIRPKKDKG